MKRLGFTRPNLGIALAAVLISVAMWLNVQQEQALILNEVVPVPINTYYSETAQYVVSGLPSSTKITVRGAQDALDRFNALYSYIKAKDGSWEVDPTKKTKTRPIVAYVDLSAVAKGKDSIRPQIRDEALRQIGVQIEMPDLPIIVEEREQKPVPVEVIPKIPDGYVFTSASVTPKTVLVSGASSVVKTVGKVVGDLDLRDFVPGKTFEVTSLHAEMYNGGPVQGVTIEDASVRATALLAQAPPQRSIVVSVVLAPNTKPAPGYRMSGYSIEPVTVIATGAGVKSLTSIDTRPVSISGLTSSVTRTAVPLSLPPGVTRLKPDRVRVRIFIEKIPPVENPAPATTGTGTGTGGHTGP